MASIKDVMYSLNGEALVKQKLGKDFSGLVLYKKGEDGKVIYPTDKDWYVFKLVDSNKKGGVRLSNIDDVKNPATGRVERVRLLSGIDSIWMKDQKEVTKEYAQINWVELRFFRNQKMLRVSKDNPTVLEFLRISNGNIGNPDRVRGSRQEFFEYDTALAEQEAYAKEEFELETALEAKAIAFDKMEKHAAFLGISLTNSDGGKKTDSGLRKDYVMYAKRNPAYFKQTLGQTDVLETAWMIKRGINEGIIDIGREMGKIFWAKNGGMIGQYPQIQNAEEYMRELAQLPTEAGQLFKKQLQQYIK